MDEDRAIAVSPRHTVMLATELFLLVERPPRQDFVVRTLARREANGLPLMNAEMVIASAETRAAHPGAASYPLHFRKTYFPGRMNGDPQIEFENHLLASQLSTIPPPLGHEPNVFRSCLIPGQPYARISPFGRDPPESNIAVAQKLVLPSAAGLWRLAQETFAQLTALHAGGLAHGDAELHNVIVSPSPLETVLIDFEVAVRRAELNNEVDWQARCARDAEPLLREAVFLQCALGQQPGPLADLATSCVEKLFKEPERFRQAIENQTKA
ncbi:MAG: hypothetical protein ABJA82_09830 [Myxococcales bacterium]